MKEELENIIEKACKDLYKNDFYLIENRLHERAIVFRFGIYLQKYIDKSNNLKKYKLDNEYNRNMDELKRTPNYPNGRYVDLLLHERGSNNNNILIIECKTDWNDNTSEDIKKIEDFMILNGIYKFQYGVSIIFRTGEVSYKIKEKDGDWINKTIIVENNAED